MSPPPHPHYNYPFNSSQTPPSSPPSSPYPTSSSPPSSPALDPLALDSDYDVEHDFSLGPRCASSSSTDSLFGVFRSEKGISAPMDPLAGSYHSIRAKRLRVKSAMGQSPNQTPMKKRARFRSLSPGNRVGVQLGVYADTDEDGGEDEGESEQVQSVLSPLDLEKHRQKLLWEQAIERVFETGERKIDLTDQNIVDIPPEVVRDLSKMVVLPETNEPALTTVDDCTINTRAGLHPSSASTGLGVGEVRRGDFSRTHTAPAATMGAWARVGPAGKAVSSNSLLGVSREAMDLFLGKNNIARLPMELWSLHNLTVLSLRNNSITYIPPEIANLRGLQTLNLAHNKLRFIPSELLQMKRLSHLNLFPNPFLPLPPAPNRSGKYVSRTTFKGPPIPPLTELALRKLLTRVVVDEDGKEETLLEQYQLPLGTSHDHRPVSAFRDIFAVCVPGSVPPDADEGHRAGRRWRREDDGEAGGSGEVTGVGICPNPVHGPSGSTFIRPAEERYTWESSTVVIEKLGGTAAVLWRGCLRGCLGFLGVAREDEEEDEKHREETGRSTDDDSMDLDDLLQSEEVVQTVRFVVGAMLGFDD